MEDLFAWDEKCWPHQRRALNEIANGIENQGWRSLCLTSPTGGGKTFLAVQLIRYHLTKGSGRVCIYTNRKMLTKQIHDVLTVCGIEHGVRAAGWVKNDKAPVQICSIQTETSRVKAGFWEQPDAGLVFIDEAHLNKSEEARKIIYKHRTNGAITIGLTATPVDIEELYDRLVVAGTNSELRACGAHVPCRVFGPDEPDTIHIKKQSSGEFSENEVRKVFKIQHVFGSILDNYRQLNPDQRPCILFAPGVEESIWCVDEFLKNGVRAAHIDADDVYYGEKDAEGERILYKSKPELREEVLRQVRTGEIKVVCNRFILREAIDIPELYHAILATVYGSITSYIQSVGRLIRAHASLDHVVLQDHGGNWWRHGSPNADREWQMDMTAKDIDDFHAQKKADKGEPEPIHCPKCHAIRLKGPKCPGCGYECTTRTRTIVQVDGTMREMRGDIFSKRKEAAKPDTAQLWERMSWRARKANMTWRQAEALFYQENKYYPGRDLPLMPLNDIDFHRKVSDTPWKNIRPKG